jgi:hypothetical protein
MHCEICRHDRLYSREGKIQTTAMTFFDLDWANASATCLVCEQCGYVHCFCPPEESMKRSASETLRVQIFVSGPVAAAEIASKLPLAAGAPPRPLRLGWDTERASADLGSLVWR